MIGFTEKFNEINGFSANSIFGYWRGTGQGRIGEPNARYAANMARARHGSDPIGLDDRAAGWQIYRRYAAVRDAGRHLGNEPHADMAAPVLRNEDLE
jgi:hypothetical protein